MLLSVNNLAMKINSSFDDTIVTHGERALSYK